MRWWNNRPFWWIISFVFAFLLVYQIILTLFVVTRFNIFLIFFFLIICLFSLFICLW